MQLDKTFWKRLALVVGGGVVLSFLLANYPVVGTVLAGIWGILFPFVLGFILAFLLNIPMTAIERVLFRGRGGRARRPVSFILTLILVLLVLGLVVFLVVPQLVDTITKFVNLMPAYVRGLERSLQPYMEYIPQLQEWVEELNIDWKNLFQGIVDMVQSGAGNFLSSAVNVATGIVGGFVSFFFGIIFACYLLLDKEHLTAQLKGLLQAYLPARTYHKAADVATLAKRHYTSFVSGQCIEALVLTLLYFLVLWVGGFQYALLIAVAVGITSLVPMIGAYIGCFVGVFLLLMSMGFWRALAFVIIMVVIQQLDGNFIYPHIMGSSMGLPPIWTLVAVLVGGGLAGMFGMLFFIPLFSVGYTLLHKNAKARLAARGIPSPVAQLPPKRPPGKRGGAAPGRGFWGRLFRRGGQSAAAVDEAPAKPAGTDEAGTGAEGGA